MESRVEVSSIPKASVSVSNRRAPDQDEVQRSEDELVVLLLMRASGMQQKCRHADSSRGRVREWNELGRADNGRSEYRDPTDAGVSAALNRTLVLIRHPPGAQIDAHNSRLRPAHRPTRAGKVCPRALATFTIQLRADASPWRFESSYPDRPADERHLH